MISRRAMLPSLTARVGLNLLLAAALLTPAVSVAHGFQSPPGAPAAVQANCPTVANVDLRKMARRQAGRINQPSPYRPDPALDGARVPASATRRPPPEASFVARVRLPPGGGYARDERAVVWREADGTWWGWRTVLNGVAPSPPPPPMPGSAEERERQVDEAAGYPWWYSTDATFEGRLDADQSARLEAAYSDPCRQLEPDQWPWEIPLLRAEDGSRTQRCQLYPDATFYMVEFTEAGRGPRSISLRCGSAGSLNAILVTGTAHVELPAAPPRRLTRDEIDELRRRGVKID